MSNAVLIFNDIKKSITNNDSVIYWNNYYEDQNSISIPKYLEKNKENIRSKYLSFIHDLGHNKINGKNVIDFLSTDSGFSYWWMNFLSQKNTHNSTSIYNCLRLLALEEILIKKSYKILKTFTSDKQLIVSLKLLCSKMNVDFKLESSYSITKNRKNKFIFSSLPFFLQALISFVKFVIKHWSLRDTVKSKWFSGKNSIFIFSYFINLNNHTISNSRFYSNLWGTFPNFVHGLNNKINWLHHFLFSDEISSTSKAKNIINNLNLKKSNNVHHLVESFLTLNLLIRALKDWCLLNFISFRLNKFKFLFYPKDSNVWLWPMLKNDWFDSLIGPNGINNCIRVQLIESILKNIPYQKFGFYIYENQGWEMAFLNSWRKNNHGKIIGIENTTIPFWCLNFSNDSRTVNSKLINKMPSPDFIAVNSQLYFNEFINQGYSSNKIIKTEALRYLDISSKNINNNKDKTEKKDFKSDNLDILVIGDMIPESMHSFLILLESFFEITPDKISFSFKPHPGYFINMKKYPKLKFKEIISESLENVLYKFDCIISTNQTSSPIDALFAGLSAIIFLDGSLLNTCPLDANNKNVIFFSTKEELYSAVNKIITVDKKNDETLFFRNPNLKLWKSFFLLLEKK